jgi:hypothetical protein
MSIRALGRQWMAQVKNAGKFYLPGVEGHPQGALFPPSLGGLAPFHSPDVKEAVRRQVSGENNPPAPWREPHWSDKWAYGYTPPRESQQQFPGMESPGM